MGEESNYTGSRKLMIIWCYSGVEWGNYIGSSLPSDILQTERFLGEEKVVGTLGVAQWSRNFVLTRPAQQVTDNNGAAAAPSPQGREGGAWWGRPSSRPKWGWEC